MNELVSVLIGGVSIGLAYAIMAIGLSLLYGATKIFNFQVPGLNPPPLGGQLLALTQQ